MWLSGILFTLNKCFFLACKFSVICWMVLNSFAVIWEIERPISSLLTAEIQNEISKFQSLCNLNSDYLTTRFVFFALKIELIRPSILKDSIEDSMKTFYCLLRLWNKNIRKNTFHIHSVVQIYHKMSYSQIWLKCAQKKYKIRQILMNNWASICLFHFRDGLCAIDNW